MNTTGSALPFNTTTMAKKAEPEKLKKFKSERCVDSDDLCNFVNKYKIVPHTILHTQKYYVLFYYE